VRHVRVARLAGPQLAVSQQLQPADVVGRDPFVIAFEAVFAFVELRLGDLGPDVDLRRVHDRVLIHRCLRAGQLAGDVLDGHTGWVERSGVDRTRVGTRAALPG